MDGLLRKRSGRRAGAYVRWVWRGIRERDMGEEGGMEWDKEGGMKYG